MEQVDRKGDKLCRMCDSAQVESAEHFACHCPKFEDLRRGCKERVLQALGEEKMPELRAAVARNDVAFFLGDQYLASLPPDIRRKVDAVVCDYLKLAWNRRRIEWAKHCVPGKEWRLR